MKDTRERNLKIFQMALDGVSPRNIALAFGLSTSRIRSVIRAIKRENAIAERRRNIAEKIRLADDLDILWKVSDMIDAIRPNTTVRNALLKHFASLNKVQISLHEMMDLVVPEMVDSIGFVSPLYRVAYIGKQGYWSIVNGLSEIVVNDRYLLVWNRKLEWLQLYASESSR